MGERVGERAERGGLLNFGFVNFGFWISGIGRGTSRRFSLIDDFPAETPGTRAEIDQVIGGGDGVFVVFDDDERVAVVAEVDEGLEEGGVVARVEADGGFVEHVEHAAEVRAELGGEADALGFAA